MSLASIEYGKDYTLVPGTLHMNSVYNIFSGDSLLDKSSVSSTSKILKLSLKSKADLTSQDVIQISSGSDLFKGAEYLVYDQTTPSCDYQSKDQQTQIAYSIQSLKSQAYGADFNLKFDKVPFVKQLKKYVKLGFAFGGSSAFNKESEMRSLNQSRYYESQSIAKRYQIKWNDTLFKTSEIDNMLDETFISDLEDLEYFYQESSQEQKVVEFIKKYGTHIVYSLTMGAQSSTKCFSSFNIQESVLIDETQNYFKSSVSTYKASAGSYSSRSSTLTSNSQTVSCNFQSLGIVDLNDCQGIQSSVLGNLAPFIVEYQLLPLWETGLSKYRGVLMVKDFFEKSLMLGEDCSKDRCNSRGICSPRNGLNFDQNDKYFGLFELNKPCICDEKYNGFNCEKLLIKQLETSTCQFCPNSCSMSDKVEQGGIVFHQETEVLIDEFYDNLKRQSEVCQQSNNNLVSSTSLCCPKDDNTTKIGECRLCSSCGSDYIFYGGSFSRRPDDPEKIDHFGEGCQYPTSAKDIDDKVQLCCKRQPICQICSQCAASGPYSIQTGKIVAHNGEGNTFIDFLLDYYTVVRRGFSCYWEFEEKYNEEASICCSPPTMITERPYDLGGKIYPKNLNASTDQTQDSLFNWRWASSLFSQFRFVTVERQFKNIDDSNSPSMILVAKDLSQRTPTVMDDYCSIMLTEIGSYHYYNQMMEVLPKVVVRVCSNQQVNSNYPYQIKPDDFQWISPLDIKYTFEFQRLRDVNGQFTNDGNYYLTLIEAK